MPAIGILPVLNGLKVAREELQTIQRRWFGLEMPFPSELAIEPKEISQGIVLSVGPTLLQLVQGPSIEADMWALLNFLGIDGAIDDFFKTSPVLQKKRH
jgi:hypothetical protein